ncbi:hypothetical protein JG687_00005995 [Phytophthora cactorum]|uniref:Uncharacterized protein n=1 Tax=Phytophthora cactorum TaxID=29920 RepID=A0A8T1UP60_9STRA|nr:hypothetical protein GQ600_7407 [Phytophthora cactorum]KAG6964424.1 hypothetical protein JG687_00005995 [Phytophthora cactorum]
MQQFEAQWQDYYRAKRSSDEGKESEEATLLRTRTPATSSVAPDNKYRCQADKTLSTMKPFLTIVLTQQLSHHLRARLKSYLMMQSQLFEQL